MLLYLSYRIMTVLIGRSYRYVGRYIGKVTIISRRPTQVWPRSRKLLLHVREQGPSKGIQPDPLIGACGVMFSATGHG